MHGTVKSELSKILIQTHQDENTNWIVLLVQCLHGKHSYFDWFLLEMIQWLLLVTQQLENSDGYAKFHLKLGMKIVFLLYSEDCVHIWLEKRNRKEIYLKTRKKRSCDYHWQNIWSTRIKQFIRPSILRTCEFIKSNSPKNQRLFEQKQTLLDIQNLNIACHYLIWCICWHFQFRGCQIEITSVNHFGEFSKYELKGSDKRLYNILKNCPLFKIVLISKTYVNNMMFHLIT